MTEPYSGFYAEEIQSQARTLMWYGAILDTDGNDAIFMPQERIAPFVDYLDSKDLLRSKEAYLSRFGQSFSEEFLTGSGSDSRMSRHTRFPFTPFQTFSLCLG